MTRQDWLLLALVFVLATTVNYVVYVSDLDAINDRISIDLRVLKVPVFLASTPGPTVVVKCIPNCAADKKILDALLVAPESRSERAARLNLDQTGKDLAKAKFDPYVREAVIVAILIGIIVAIRVRARATQRPRHT